MDNSRNSVRQVDSLNDDEQKVYNLTKNGATEFLESENVPVGKGMLNKWCLDGVIDSVRITKGPRDTRGLRISETSLKAFIFRKKGTVVDVVNAMVEKDLEIERLTKLLKQARAEIKSLKEEGKEIKIEEFSITPDFFEAKFKYKRSNYTATFDTTSGELIEVAKGKSLKSVFNDLTTEEKAAIIEMRNTEIQKG